MIEWFQQHEEKLFIGGVLWFMLLIIPVAMIEALPFGWLPATLWFTYWFSCIQWDYIVGLFE